MKRRHLPQAGLCQSCLDRLVESISQDPQQRINLTWCPHRRTFAKVAIESGYVVRWELASPIDDDQARAYFERQAALATPLSPLPGSRVQ